MAHWLLAGLAFGAVGSALGMTVDHQTQVDHHSGPVAVKYRSDVAIKYKEVGTVAPGGRASSLRCDWAATMLVERQALATSGSSLSRSFHSKPVMSGSRSGWCSTSKVAITKEVADRAADMQRHLVLLARQDEAFLRAELDRIHGRQRVG